MQPAKRACSVVLVLVVAYLLLYDKPAHGQSRATTIAPTALADLRAWDNTLDQMLRAGDLKVRLQRPDTLIPGRTIEQLDQYYNGVQVWGGSVSRQLDRSSTVSIFGSLYQALSIDVTPTLSQQDAKTAVETIGGTTLGPDRLPKLAILPLDDGSFRLVWVGDISTTTDRLRLFIDARTGAVVRRDSLVERQAPNAFVGRGTGVLGDTKKVSTMASGGGFIASDSLRPPEISTFDLRSNFSRAIALFNGATPLLTSDIASTTSSDVWTDTAVVDAHVYSSYTYDYYFKRFGRRGLDNADKRIFNFTHLVSRNDLFTAPPSVVGMFYANAFYAGDGLMVYGEGFPPGVFFVSTGQHWDFLAGAIDVVAHELTHGVTQFTSNLEYVNESGALNEAFSDIMGASVEFFFQPVGNGPMKADYLMGEDVITAAVPGALNGLRSLENPGLYGQPDHYSKFVVSPPDADHDNGGVHTNSGIANQAFYLAIEGGTNRTSGIKVQGLGASNREQIEKVFYRAFAQLMPSNANYAMARIITLRAATDLFGANSAPFTAVRDAWTAVGVN